MQAPSGNGTYIMLARPAYGGQSIAYIPTRANYVVNRVNVGVVVGSIIAVLVVAGSVAGLTIYVMRLKRRAREKSVYRSITDGV